MVQCNINTFMKNIKSLLIGISLIIFVTVISGVAITDENYQKTVGQMYTDNPMSGIQ